MAKGAEAKERVIKKIAEAFGDDFIGEYEKKIYIWSKEDNAPVQVAISLTCPKNPIEAPGTKEVLGDWDWSDSPTTNAAPTAQEVVEITKEEQDNLRMMLEKLGL